MGINTNTNRDGPWFPGALRPFVQALEFWGSQGLTGWSVLQRLAAEAPRDGGKWSVMFRTFGRRTLWILAMSMMAGVDADAQVPGSSKALVPTKLWAAQTGEKSVTLTWVGTPGAVQYRVYRCQGIVSMLCASAALIAQLAGNTAQMVTPLVGATPVTIFIQAINAAGIFSEPIAFNPVIPMGKNAITAISPKTSSVTAAQTGNTITVTWQPVAGATAYAIGRSVAPEGFRSACRLCSTETRFIDSAITPGARHIYAIAVITPRGVAPSVRSNVVTPGGSSAFDSAKTRVSADSTKSGTSPDTSKSRIAAPPMFRALLAALTARLSWAGVPNAKGYVVYRSIGNGPWVRLAGLPPTSRSFADNVSAALAGRIRYRLEAFDAKGASPFVETSVEKQAAGKGATRE